MEKLKIHPQKMSREYGSNIYVTKEGITNRMQFRTSVIYAGMFMNEYPVFHLYKHDIYINNKYPDEHSYRLAHACNRVFYPIVAICNVYGQIVAIRNDLPRERWARAKPDIAREFGGTPAEQYIKNTELRLSDPVKILDIVKKDLFFYAFFSPKYKSGVEEEIFPLATFTDGIKINFVHSATSGEDRGSAVKKEGIVTDESEYNYGQLLKSYEIAEAGKIAGTCNITYELDENMLTGSISVDTNLKKEDGAPLMQLKMQSYYLSEYPLQAIEDTETIKLGNKMAKQKKKMNRKWL